MDSENLLLNRMGQSGYESIPQHSRNQSTMTATTNAFASETTPTQVEKLECGTSLAEWEHENDGRQETAAANKQQQPPHGTTITPDALRESIASDIVTSSSSSHPLEMFTSPFEIPSGCSSNNNNTSVTTAATTTRGGHDSNDKFLKVPLVYCDQTASNRPVRSIETYVQNVCLPLYGNTHTNTSVTGSQSTAFVAEARQIVAEATNAKITGKASLDLVLFA